MPHLFPPNRRRLYYVYLVQFFIPACYLAWLPHPWQMALGAFLLLLFAAVYVASAWVDYTWLVVCILAEIILMLVSAVVLNPGFFGTLFWPAAAIASLKRWHRPVMLVAMIVSSLIELEWLCTIHHVSLVPYLPMVIAGIFSTVLTTASVAWGISSMRTKEALREAELTIERLTKTAERERISQDLHDVMGHELAMIALKAQVARKLIPHDGARAAGELQDISQSAKQALARVRAYIADVVTPQLSEEWDAAVKLLQAAEITWIAPPQTPDLALDAQAEGVLAMCLRETVTNIVKHSGATAVTVSCDEDDTHVWLVVIDNGRGFLAAATRTAADEMPSTHGISGMRARLAAIGGQLGIWSGGTWLTEPGRVREVSGITSGSLVQLVVPKRTSDVESVGAIRVEGLS